MPFSTHALRRLKKYVTDDCDKVTLASSSYYKMAATDGLVTKIVSQREPSIPQHILRDRPPPLTRYSTIGVADSAWCSRDFILGAGMVIIQRNTHKVVVLFDSQKRRWFFPRGRKDIGESLEEAALREAYEEVRMPIFLNNMF